MGPSSNGPHQVTCRAEAHAFLHLLVANLSRPLTANPTRAGMVYVCRELAPCSSL